MLKHNCIGCFLAVCGNGELIIYMEHVFGQLLNFVWSGRAPPFTLLLNVDFLSPPDLPNPGQNENPASSSTTVTATNIVTMWKYRRRRQ
eukprot:9163210-Ditylum_brightwellii.AAC.1